jgi:hypothetical protein
MSQVLDKVERELVEQILKQHPIYGEILKNQLEDLFVSSRELTGVGCYTKFSTKKEIVDKSINATLGFNGEIEVPGVPSGLCCVLDVSDGRLNYIELVTFGTEQWNGQLNDFHIVPAK